MQTKKYKFAFIIERYFEFGGQQRDMLRFAKATVARGHSVTVFTTSWSGADDPEIAVEIIPAKASSNHKTMRNIERFAGELRSQKKFDCIVGFSRIGGLGVYFAADAVLRERLIASGKYWRRFLPRYATYLKLEANTFSPEAETQICALSENQRAHIIKHYNTPADRITVLSPGINRDAINAANLTLQERSEFRNSLGVSDEKIMLLTVAADFKTKGVDRSVRAIASLPAELREKVIYVVAGPGKPKTILPLAKKLGIEKQLVFVGAQSQVGKFYHAADLLIHPARNENTGLTLLEALASGAPVLVTENCGYAHYISDANGGRVLRGDFDQQLLNRELQALLSDLPALKKLGQNAKIFCQTADISSMTKQFVDLLENACQK